MKVNFFTIIELEMIICTIKACFRNKKFSDNELALISFA